MPRVFFLNSDLQLMKHFIIKYSLDAHNHSEVIIISPFNSWRNGAERRRDLLEIP